MHRRFARLQAWVAGQRQRIYDQAGDPEQREILRTWWVTLLVAIFAMIVGIPSDLENIPAELHDYAVAIRLFFTVCFAAMLLGSITAPRRIIRWHTSLALVMIGSTYVFLTWLDASSGDIARSGYHRGLVLPSIALMVARRISISVQAVALALGVVYYGVVVSYSYGLSFSEAGVAHKNFRDIMMDLVQIHLILYLVFRSYRSYQVEDMRLRQLLKRANDAKSEVIAKVNHELQVPVLGILANLDSLDSRLSDASEPVRRLLDRTQNYCLYQRTLINNMIYASASSAQQDPFFVDREATADLRLAYNRSVDLVGDIHDGQLLSSAVPDVSIACQNEILMIVLVNILSNCAEHASEVRIEWKIGDEELLTMRTENDLVMPLDIDEIFEPWSTSRAATAAQQTGAEKTKPILGLGLNIARELVEKIGGRIDAREDRQRFYLDMSLPMRV